MPTMKEKWMVPAQVQSYLNYLDPYRQSALKTVVREMLRGPDRRSDRAVQEEVRQLHPSQALWLWKYLAVTREQGHVSVASV